MTDRPVSSRKGIRTVVFIVFIFNECLDKTDGCAIFVKTLNKQHTYGQQT